jgi:hypothetical protein
MAISDTTLNTNDTPPKCANPACGRTVSPDQTYWGDHRATSAPRDACDCGHDECEAYTEQQR